eukprot:CAMPEP_0204202926 /NCGR_PEP_ID=MMETSP0361-20130328/68581_1 /ASSEMBLY_ACC=CAM_ASM_000343 /TAXON_ID=268821 /ORGANISM="Scrippsiella Hangoei, Strain SHTV-5" /LENGTH=103 /DNA_ID=CAMNT_0051165821 /DNA_START=15 /DNA_END=322 /DNA_ORIENTATION=+
MAPSAPASIESSMSESSSSPAGESLGSFPGRGLAGEANFKADVLTSADFAAFPTAPAFSAVRCAATTTLESEAGPRALGAATAPLEMSAFRRARPSPLLLDSP